MGHVYVDAAIFARRRTTARFLVDTGAMHTIVPPALARQIGATTLSGHFAVTLAGGSRRRLKVCSVGIEVCDRTGPTTALVPPGGEPLLGVEARGLRVNPAARCLEPTRAQTALLVGVRPTPARRARHRRRRG